MAGINDDGVMATNDDAHICKRSCVTLNYWEDPYLECFSKGHFERKPPEINRGYYARISGECNNRPDMNNSTKDCHPSKQLSIICCNNF